jgi:hypothetical protein
MFYRVSGLRCLDQSDMTALLPRWSSGLPALTQIDMTPTASIRPLGSEFDDFLFALVGEDRNGMPLSVVSVLARMDLDPWMEAANLAALPAETAVRKLAGWLDALSDSALNPASPDTRAARLIALLPRRENPNSPPPVTGTSAIAAARPRPLINATLLAIYMILSLGIQFVIARRELPVCPELMHAPASANVPSQAPPTTSNK